MVIVDVVNFISCLYIGWLGSKVGGHLCTVLHSSHVPSELLQCLHNDDSTRNIVLGIIIIIIIIIIICPR